MGDAFTTRPTYWNPAIEQITLAAAVSSPAEQTEKFVPFGAWNTTSPDQEFAVPMVTWRPPVKGKTLHVMYFFIMWRWSVILGCAKLFFVMFVAVNIKTLHMIVFMRWLTVRGEYQNSRCRQRGRGSGCSSRCCSPVDSDPGWWTYCYIGPARLARASDQLARGNWTRLLVYSSKHIRVILKGTPVAVWSYWKIIVPWYVLNFSILCQGGKKL